MMKKTRTATFIVFYPESPPEFFDTAEAAKAAAEALLLEYRDMSIDGWSEDVTGIEWGEYICRGRVVQTACEPVEDPEDSDFGEMWDFGLRAP